MADIPVCKNDALWDGAVRIVELGNLQVAFIRNDGPNLA